MTNIYVFGSNLAGIHGAGSAKLAKNNYGARNGIGVGRTGNAYAIPTKDVRLQVLSLDIIKNHVNDFLRYASERPDLTFHVVDIGCGLAGYSPEQIAPMFKVRSDNVKISTKFKKVLGEKK